MELAKILLEQVFVMFLLLAVGVICFKSKMVTNETNKQMADIALMVVTPCVIISAFQTPYSVELVKGLFFSFLLAFIVHIVGILLTFVLKRSNKYDSQTEKFTLVYSNCGFMAIPLISATFGDMGVFYISTYLMVFNLFQWTHGVSLLTGKRDFKSLIKLLKSPVIISVFIGLFIFFFKIQIFSPVSRAINFIAQMNTPLAMVATGGFIAQTNLFKAFAKPRIYLITCFKLLILPVICMAIFKMFPIDHTISTTILIAAACPTATSSIFFSSKYGHDASYASQIVAIATLLSIITIPLIVYIQSLI